MKQLTEQQVDDLKDAISLLWTSADLMDNLIIKIAYILNTDDKRLRRNDYNFYAKLDQLIDMSRNLVKMTQRNYDWEKIEKTEIDVNEIIKFLKCNSENIN